MLRVKVDHVNPNLRILEQPVGSAFSLRLTEALDAFRACTIAPSLSLSLSRATLVD